MPDLLETQQFTQSFLEKLMQPQEEEMKIKVSRNSPAMVKTKRPKTFTTQGETAKNKIE